ncbi:recombinase family protein [Nonlabens sp. YIK11]|uniref:recombinase family protein n=1 Tax=Nonlabens sp. YIK11 TaxID=1453349 RepID=UPI003977B5EE
MYTRLSKEDADSNSINNQLRTGKLFFKDLGIDESKIKVYNEGEGISGGAEIEDRPQLQQLILDIQNGLISTAWFRDQKRLERSGMTLFLFTEVVKKSKVDVYFGNDLEDFKNPKGFIMRGLKSLLNESTRLEQSWETKKQLHLNMKEGKHRGGMHTYGYTSDENGYVIVDEEEAKIVRRIYQMSMDGIGTRAIARTLNKEGVATRSNTVKGGSGKRITVNKHTGKETITDIKDIKWAGNTVRGIIVNEKYKGIAYLGSEELGERKQYDYPIIIEPKEWKKVNDNLKSNRNNSGKNVKHKYLLEGMIECGRCGRNYYGRTRKDKSDHYYLCSSKRFPELNCGNKSINIDFIENFIWSTLTSSSLKNQINLQLATGDDKPKLDTLQLEVEQLHKELTKHKNAKKKAIQSSFYSDDDRDVEDIVKAIQSKIESTEEILDKKEKELDYLSDASNKLDKVKDELSNVKQETPFNLRQEIINKFIKRIFIESDNNQHMYEVKIEYNAPIWDNIFVTNQAYSIIKEMHPIKAIPQTIEWIKEPKNVTYKKQLYTKVEQYQPKFKHKHIFNTSFEQSPWEIAEMNYYYNKLSN